MREIILVGLGQMGTQINTEAKRAVEALRAARFHTSVRTGNLLCRLLNSICIERHSLLRRDDLNSAKLAVARKCFNLALVYGSEAFGFGPRLNLRISRSIHGHRDDVADTRAWSDICTFPVTIR